MLVLIRACRFPLHDLDPAHIWPSAGQAVTEGPIRVSILDNGEWFIQDGRHRLIRAFLRGEDWIEAIDHDEESPDG